MEHGQVDDAIAFGCQVAPGGIPRPDFPADPAQLAMDAADT